MNKSKVKFMLLVIAIFIVSACSKDTAITEKEDSTKNDAEPTMYTYPFTGVLTENEPTNRAIAVMINNHPSARPHSGLTEADIVFEILAEGSITRFLAIFQSSVPEKIGSVRSAREYYAKLAKDYDALYVYHGAADFINEKIAAGQIDYVNGSFHDDDGHLFVREAFRQAPHNSYLMAHNVYEVAEDKGYETEKQYDSLTFLDESEEVTGEVATYIALHYSNSSMPDVEYEYNEATRTYERISDGEQTIELVSEKPIELDNIFVIETKHEVIDKEGRRAIDFDSGGFGYLFQQGKIQQVEWENRDGKIVPMKNGDVVPFVQGKTWINVLPTEPSSSTIEQIHYSESKD